MRDGPPVDSLVDRLAAAPEMHRGLCGGHVFGSEMIHRFLSSLPWKYRVGSCHLSPIRPVLDKVAVNANPATDPAAGNLVVTDQSID